MYELIPIYSSQKSFYGKAMVREGHNGYDKHIYELYSYETLVARVEKTDNKIKYVCFGKFSQTTTRHQKEFFKQYNLNDNEIKELFKKGVLEHEN